ncbi:MAG: hypothetical protein A2Y33_10255 [Spirochaetes bacterium GWF1_51_8]|nr:MAG: hypothetical protein A2Y33_10255 [Spirochaetes bacterium GWF1_51_8]
MLKFIRNGLRWLLGGSFTLLIAACYGVPANFKQKNVEMKFTGKDQKPIPGLEVKLIAGEYAQSPMKTDDEGKVFFNVSNLDKGKYIIEVADTDGAKNGGSYQPVTLSNLDFGSIGTNYQITMTDK